MALDTSDSLRAWWLTPNSFNPFSPQPSGAHKDRQLRSHLSLFIDLRPWSPLGVPPIGVPCKSYNRSTIFVSSQPSPINNSDLPSDVPKSSWHMMPSLHETWNHSQLTHGTHISHRRPAVAAKSLGHMAPSMLDMWHHPHCPLEILKKNQRSRSSILSH